MRPLVGPAGSDHYHGSIEMRILGQTVDFSRSRFQLQDDRFHFESGDGRQWHAHASGVTLGYAMSTLGFEVTQDAVSVGEETYAEGEYTVIVAVNGDAVVPDEYVLQEGDHVRIVVQEP